jgi:hypothetical protein
MRGNKLRIGAHPELVWQEIPQAEAPKELYGPADTNQAGPLFRALGLISTCPSSQLLSVSIPAASLLSSCRVAAAYSSCLCDTSGCLPTLQLPSDEYFTLLYLKFPLFKELVQH